MADRDPISVTHLGEPAAPDLSATSALRIGGVYEPTLSVSAQRFYLSAKGGGFRQGLLARPLRSAAHRRLVDDEPRSLHVVFDHTIHERFELFTCLAVGSFDGHG